MDSLMTKLMYGDEATQKEALSTIEHDNKLYMNAMFNPGKTKFFVKDLITKPDAGEMIFLGHMVDIKQLL